MSLEALVARAFQVLLAMAGAYVVTLWFALVVWTFRDIESRSRSVVAQIFSTLVVVLFFVPGLLIYLILRPRQTLDEAFGRSLEEEYLLQDLEDLSLCPNCHRPVRDEFVVCPACYTELRRACPACARLVDLTWAICPYCTADLAPVVLETGEEAREVPWEEQPRAPLLPRPLRALREQTGERVKQLIELVPDVAARRAQGDGDGHAPPADAANGHTAPEDETAFLPGAWGNVRVPALLTRARELLRPLRPDDFDEAGNGNGHAGANGHHRGSTTYEGRSTTYEAAGDPDGGEDGAEEAAAGPARPPGDGARDQ
ncbi:MAG TPA: zinc ribbon domain-containing protein [Thermomicrobiales bacterium]|nr:zinc ribbon domain-containing protein [Thermomicrobiales bacterium]